ncbi:MarR family winged helix-turn-helix transcriptional regulator [Streptomonospora litoralis]|uniref:DNA-binding transcriptional repressor MarR n=1 Tax=Streptomonospora litoralis TaxID=2498135 RepID=A0A4P6PZ86_9ACTN|nr:MarR family transcriptional regulator [Streptomonospora litoralis]QBI53060.1 DNA-binding transcriptional repressor MarR [Streptomonospora litoralis]
MDADTEPGPDRGSAGADLGWRLSTAVVLFHEAVGQRLGLRALDHRALGLIEREGPLTAGGLADMTGLTPGAVTGLVDRLRRHGYVQRTPDPADRRRILISVDTATRPDFAGAFTGLAGAMSELLAGYDDTELAAIEDYVRNTIEILNAETRRLAAPGGDGAPSGDK